MAANPEVPVALTIAGSDSSAGAGIQADLKTFGALSVYGLTAITSIVAETPGLVSEIEAVSAEMVRATGQPVTSEESVMPGRFLDET